MKTILDISLLNSCNFHCNYCISKSLHAEESPSGRYEIKGSAIDPDPLIDYIKKWFPKDSIIQLSGGEPLTYLPLTYVVKELIDNYSIVINTNGALIKNVPKLYDLPINWRVSVHPEQREIEILYKDIEELINRKSKIMLNYVVHPRHIKNDATYAFNIIEYMETQGISFEVTGFTGNYMGRNIKHFDDIYDGIITELPKVKSVRYVSIEADGRVYPCHGYGNGINIIGNIYDNLFDESKLCDRNCAGPGGVSWCQSITSILRLNLV